MTAWSLYSMTYLNTLRPRQNVRHFPDDIFKCVFLNENVWIPIKISLKFVPKGPIYNIPALVQIIWRRPGDKPLSEPMMVSLPTHICVASPQWVKPYLIGHCKTWYVMKIGTETKLHRNFKKCFCELFLPTACCTCGLFHAYPPILSEFDIL